MSVMATSGCPGTPTLSRRPKRDRVGRFDHQEAPMRPARTGDRRVVRVGLAAAAEAHSLCRLVEPERQRGEEALEVVRRLPLVVFAIGDDGHAQAELLIAEVRILARLERVPDEEATLKLDSDRFGGAFSTSIGGDDADDRDPRNVIGERTATSKRATGPSFQPKDEATFLMEGDDGDRSRRPRNNVKSCCETIGHACAPRC
jgi:hypothetical protein